MGLFDGRIDGELPPVPRSGSTAHVAALLGAPVILVVDARGQSHSIAALLHGFSTFDTSIRIAGVILNRVGSPATRRCCGRPANTRACRCSARSRGPTNCPFRHGISAWSPPSNTVSRHSAAVDAMIELVARHVDLAAVIAVAGQPAVDGAAVGSGRRRRPSAARRHRRARGGQGVQLRLRRARRTAARRRCRGRGVRPADRPAAAADRRAGAARRLPRAVQHRAVRQRCCAPTDPRRSPPAARRCTRSARA